MKIYTDIYNQLLSAFPEVPPEMGAILGTIDGVVVSNCVIDKNAAELERAVYCASFAKDNFFKKW